ncbi:terpene cyclase/mutase family protein [Phycisphaeraceae bacterium D3-23]
MTTSCLGVLALCLVALPITAQDVEALVVEDTAAEATSAGAEGGEAAPREDAVDFVEVTDEMEEAVARGLAYLAEQQNEDGSFTAERYGGGHAGVTAICCLAFMANGELPGRGDYGPVVEKGLAYMLSHAQASGLIASPHVSHGPMYGHGFATLFLAEIYGMTDDEQVRDALVKAVRLIVKCQNHEGGWRYQPIPFDADLSVTICQIKALRAARMVGISVPDETIEDAIGYVKNCQNTRDGGFQYMTSGGSSAFPRSAAGVASLYYAGVYEGDAIEDGLAYLHSQIESGNDRGGHEYYGHYYCSQAMFIAGGEHWASYFPYIRERLIERQQRDGRWESPHGGPYATGMALIVLQMPYRLLPIFQR